MFFSDSLQMDLDFARQGNDLGRQSPDGRQVQRSSATLIGPRSPRNRNSWTLRHRMRPDWTTNDRQRVLWLSEWRSARVSPRKPGLPARGSVFSIERTSWDIHRRALSRCSVRADVAARDVLKTTIGEQAGLIRSILQQHLQLWSRDTTQRTGASRRRPAGSIRIPVDAGGSRAAQSGQFRRLALRFGLQMHRS
jgi:hypothetical protein